MVDACIICQTEPVDDSAWYRCESTAEVICPWCQKDFHKIRELVSTHDGSDYHARQLFDEIEQIIDKGN